MHPSVWIRAIIFEGFIAGITTASNNFWIDGDHNYLGEWVDAAPVGQSDKGWTIIPPSGHGTYEFFYNRQTNQFKLAAFDGPTIYVYDYTRPYIYVKDGNNVEFNGEMPGNPIQILDESVGGHSGLSTAANGSGLGNGTLGWYKFAVPSHDTPITFQFYHNNDKTVVPSGPLTDESTGDVYYYWDGERYVKLNSREEAANLRRIVAHVRVQGTTVPTCDGVPMNGPSSFYGQMYYWMAVTKYNDGQLMVITDGTHHYDQTITSDVYLEWTNEQGADYVVLDSETLEHRLANKTGRGTIIQLQKNRDTPPTMDGNVVGIDTKVQDGNVWTNTTNLGATWWGTSLDSPWKGSQAWTDGVIANYNDSRYLYMENGLNGNPDVYIVTAEDGTTQKVYNVTVTSGAPSDPLAIQNPEADIQTLVFPNPAKDYLTAACDGLLEIVDMQGRVVLSRHCCAGEQIAISHLPRGLYTVILDTNKKHKLVIH